MSTRRDFLQGLGLASTVVTSTNIGCNQKQQDTAMSIGVRDAEPAPWDSGIPVNWEIFPYGIQIGDVQSDSALISIHGTVDTIHYQLLKGVDQNWVLVESDEKVLENGWLRFELNNLQADTVYSLVISNSEQSQGTSVHRFRTALDSKSWRIVSFGATSCLGGNLPWPNLTQASQEQYDFFLFLGDTVYTHAQSKQEYWAHWDEVLQVQGLRDLFSSTSVIATWDDHEITNNFDWDLIEDAATLHENALWAFQRAFPQRTEQTGHIWRKISHGQIVDVFVLDCRGERHLNDGIYISVEQMSWLKSQLSASTARFKIIMNSVPITDFEDLMQSIESDDRWQGNPAQRMEILEHIENQAIEGVLWISGDFHFGLISKVGRVGDVGDAMYEVLAGPSGSFLNPMGEYMIETEQYLHSFAAWNHTRFECNALTGEILVQYIGDDGSILLEKTLLL